MPSPDVDVHAEHTPERLRRAKQGGRNWVESG